MADRLNQNQLTAKVLFAFDTHLNVRIRVSFKGASRLCFKNYGEMFSKLDNRLKIFVTHTTDLRHKPCTSLFFYLLGNLIFIGCGRCSLSL